MKQLVFFCLLSLGISASGQEALRTRHFNLEPNGIGIKGYDPVSYYNDKSPQEGLKKWLFRYNGVSYQFANQKNLLAFKEESAKFEPVYGGWCAYAMGETGEKIEVDPETYKIIEGKLYLFYNFYFTNTLKKWNKEQDRLKSAADDNWFRIYR